jgi:molecular chaperone GrpE
MKSKNEAPHIQRKDEKDNHMEVKYVHKKNAQDKNKADDDKQLKKELKEKDKLLKELKEKIKELQNDYLRQAAEKENLRKRLDREKEEFFQYALSDLLKDILLILDNFDRALEEQKNQADDKSFREGIAMIHRQLLDFLKKQGVSRIEEAAGAFDPNLHQAFLTEESDKVGETTVSEELQKGYKLHDRLLRPALVKVLVPKKSEDK